MNISFLRLCTIILILVVVLPNILDIISGPKLVRLDRKAKMKSKMENLPPRFAKVSDNLYRGGQPKTSHLVKMKEIGITSIINLRKEAINEIKKEGLACDALEIEYLPNPTLSLLGMDSSLIDSIIAEIKIQLKKGNTIFIHCRNGRDRTSTICAVYQVLFHNVDPKKAWQEQALDFDHQPKNPIYYGFYPRYCKYLRSRGYEI